MSSCLTATELSALAREASASPPSPEQQQHLLDCADCRARLLHAFRAHAHLTLPDHESLDETAPSGEGVISGLEAIPSLAQRYGLRGDGRDAEPEVLGRGGYGKVLLARDLSVGRDVALKCLRSKMVHSAQRPQAEARLLREARVIGQLEHPAIVPLYDVGRTAEGQLFYTMRRIRGRTLAEVVKDTPAFSERLRLLPHVLAACHAIAYAHSRGVIHRDLKPQNVMVDRFGQTAVIDWGLAATRQSAAEEASPGASGGLRLLGQESLSDGQGRLGTPAYMSPEQLAGVRGLIDEKSDVWGLGGILYEVLTGHSPRETGPLSNKPQPVRSHEAECPKDLAALCEKAIAEGRGDRYESAEALAADLDAWLHGRQVTAHVYRPAELFKRFVGEHRIALVVGLVSMLVFSVAAVTTFFRQREQRNRAREFGLSMLAEVLPRLSLTGDSKFLTQFTARVQDWLDTAGPGGDEAAVSHAWLQLASYANGMSNVTDALRYANRCLAAASEVTDPRDRYALEQACEVLRVQYAEGLLTTERSARTEALWDARPAPQALDHLWTIEARHLVATQRFFHANHNQSAVDELGSAREVLKLAQRRRELAPSDPATQVALVDALIYGAIAASNAHDTGASLRFAADAAREARQLLRLSHSEEALNRLCEALVNEVATRRWHAPDEPKEERAKLEQEAREALRAYVTMTQGANEALISDIQFELTVGDLDALPAMLERVQVGTLQQDSRALYLFGLVATNRPAEGLALTKWLDQEPSFDIVMCFSLLAAEAGDWKRAATLARRAAESDQASLWTIDGMLAWADRAQGPAAEAFRRFARAQGEAQLTSDNEGTRRALVVLADGFDALARP